MRENRLAEVDTEANTPNYHDLIMRVSADGGSERRGMLGGEGDCVCATVALAPMSTQKSNSEST
jgi:hypothetical protein